MFVQILLKRVKIFMISNKHIMIVYFMIYLRLLIRYHKSLYFFH